MLNDTTYWSKVKKEAFLLHHVPFFFPPPIFRRGETAFRSHSSRGELIKRTIRAFAEEVQPVVGQLSRQPIHSPRSLAWCSCCPVCWSSCSGGVAACLFSRKVPINPDPSSGQSHQDKASDGYRKHASAAWSVRCRQSCLLSPPAESERYRRRKTERMGRQQCRLGRVQSYCCSEQTALEVRTAARYH